MSGSRTSGLEWTIAIISGLLVLGALGYALFAAVTAEEHAPRVTVRADSVVVTDDGYLVMFTARNDGGETAASVGIVGIVRRDTILEERRTTLDYVPVRSERSGGLLFGTDPRAASLELRTSGFSLP